MIPGYVLALVLAAGWLSIFAFRAEAVTKSFPSYGLWERLWVLATPAVIASHVALSCALLSRMPAPPPGREAASVALCAAGVGFWLWARRAIGPMLVRRLPDEPPEMLRRDGPFGLVRNPLYFGTLLAAAAPAVAAGRPLLVITFALCVLALFVRSVQEERRLHAQLGNEYAAYCREVKRLVPFVW
jgi:protein-S-isoprenylcysteine O-methyltransferase Ste14